MPKPTAAAALLAFLLLASACDQSTAEVIGEINAAREGCTSDSLQAGSEECVQMFETYAEMGSEAMQTYVGALKALDQAVGRMPSGLDTTGLGEIFTLDPESYDDPERNAFDERFRAAPTAVGRQAPTSGMADYPSYPSYPDTAADNRREEQAEYSPYSPMEYRPRPLPGAGQPMPPGRGVLRPPAERLDRPWLREEIPMRAYPPQDRLPYPATDTLRTPSNRRPPRTGW